VLPKEIGSICVFSSVASLSLSEYKYPVLSVPKHDLVRVDRLQAHRSDPLHYPQRAQPQLQARPPRLDRSGGAIRLVRAEAAARVGLAGGSTRFTLARGGSRFTLARGGSRFTRVGGVARAGTDGDAGSCGRSVRMGAAADGAAGSCGRSVRMGATSFCSSVIYG
jgi:hypothetical protein